MIGMKAVELIAAMITQPAFSMEKATIMRGKCPDGRVAYGGGAPIDSDLMGG